eukprot:gene36060-43731_t
MNIGEVKQELERIGISTATPGLSGEERYEELLHRLNKAKGKLEVLHSQQSTASLLMNKDDISTMGNLSIGELRSRLTLLGVSTNTPGLTGEARWNELMKRLVGAICGDDDVPPSNPAKEVVIHPPQTKNRLPPPLPEPVATSPPKEAPAAENPQPESSQAAHSIVDFSDLKKQLKKLLNRRALEVARKLGAGDGGDPTLLSLNKRLEKI